MTEPATPETRPSQPSALDLFERFMPFIAVGAMVVTFLLLPVPFAVAFIALVWLVATRLTRTRRFLGFTLTEALAWSSTLIVVELGLALVVFALSPSAG